MRLTLTLEPKNNDFTLPLNYQYYLYISFFIIFDNAKEEFKEWATKNKYTNRNGRYYLYNFSNIHFMNDKVIDISTATITSSGNVELTFSAPIFDKEIKDYLIELFKGNDIHFYPAKRENQEFIITDVVEQDEVEFEEISKYRMTSSSCYFTGNYGHFYKIGDGTLEKKLIYDLKIKYELVYKKEYDGEINLFFDEEYQKVRKVTKLITMKENTEKEYKIRSFYCPLTIEASPEMQYIAYTCGIGMKNKFGFGSLKLLPKVEEIEVQNIDSSQQIEVQNSETTQTNEDGILSKVKNLFKFGKN